MKLKGKKIGFILTGSFCTFQKTIEQMEKIIKEEAKVIPIMSYNSYKLDTKFGKARENIILNYTLQTFSMRSRTSWLSTKSI